MKRTIILFGILFVAGMATTSYAKDRATPMEQMAQHNMMQMDAPADNRISLKLTPQMKQRQLANMRSHVEAVRNIIGLLGKGEFDKASEIAHSKLGLTPEMKKMCNMFANDDFRKLGLAFHKSADELGDVLKTGNMKGSLNALHRTMNSCVKCHAAFRQ